MGVGKVLGGMWVILGGAGVLIASSLLLFPSNENKRVPQNFVCAPEALTEKSARATVVMTGTVEGVLPGSPYADVWVRPDTVYQGKVEKFVRFAAWPSKGATAKIGDLHFVTGEKKYLWYFRKLSDGTLTTSSCYGTHRLPTTGLTEGEQAVLGVGHRP